jgi:membrane-associated phospholipid phosphatase
LAWLRRHGFGQWNTPAPPILPLWFAGFIVLVAVLVVLGDPRTTPAAAALQRWDDAWGLRLGVQPGPLQLLAQSVTMAFTALPVVLSMGIVGAYALWSRRSHLARFVGALALGGAAQVAATELMKNVAGRQRPDTLFLADGSWADSWTILGRGDSFPSGHAAFGVVLALVGAAYWPSGRWGWYALAALIALSRCILVRHNVSDVVAAAGVGWCIGAWVVLARPPFPDHGPASPREV